jgi:hypothetical protein
VPRSAKPTSNPVAIADERYKLIVQTCDEILAGQHRDMSSLLIPHRLREEVGTRIGAALLWAWAASGVIIELLRHLRSAPDRPTACRRKPVGARRYGRWHRYQLGAGLCRSSGGADRQAYRAAVERAIARGLKRPENGERKVRAA